jgi:mannose-6-phosphate isomerase-like protein (cupin superfamily)
MDPRFNDIANSPENSVFAVVFFPDRIYHEQYLNATRSGRYRYNVQEVRGYLDINCLKGQVFMDGQFLTTFVRIEYRGSRLTEQVRLKNGQLRHSCKAWTRFRSAPDAGAIDEVEDTIRLIYDTWINAYQVELWGSLDPLPGSVHDVAILDMMGKGGQITRSRPLDRMVSDVGSIKTVELAFREDDRTYPSGSAIPDPAWDNNYGRTHQERRNPNPSSQDNTVKDLNYLLDFQRGWFKRAADVQPVLYRNAMMLADANGKYSNRDAKDDNIIAMRWLFQRELGGTNIFFHEVTVEPGKVEGNHQHVGSEELYYVVSGKGIAYLRVGDDPALGDADDKTYDTESREVFGLGMKDFKALPVEAGSMIYTKSGGMHGIRNPAENAEPLKFVAFLYHSS